MELESANPSKTSLSVWERRCLLFPPLLIVEPVTVTGIGFSHRETKKTNEKDQAYPVGFDPANGQRVICRLGHFPLWYSASYLVLDKQDRSFLSRIRVYDGNLKKQVFKDGKSYPRRWTRQGHLRDMVPITERAKPAIDWTLICAELAVLLGISSLIQKRQRKTAPVSPSILEKRDATATD